MISIIYTTTRLDPKFEWFVDSLYHQILRDPDSPNEVELIKIQFDPTEPDQFACNSLGALIIPPKPSIYQGSQRRTSCDMFSQSSVRNTGAMRSRGDYLVFVDDVSIAMPGWWNAVKEAAAKGIVVGGAYQKHFEMVVEDGKLISSNQKTTEVLENGKMVKKLSGMDCRWDLGNDNGPVRVGGGQLYGCSLGIPYSEFVKINGYDELADSIGYEDINFGLRLELAGVPIYYDRRMLTIESEELHNQPYLMKREDRVLPPEAYIAKLATFGPKVRHTTGAFDSSHMLLDIVLGTKQAWSFGNNYTISDERKNGTLPKVPDTTHHWFDDKLLSEL